jgi:hypothetical protein
MRESEKSTTFSSRRAHWPPVAMEETVVDTRPKRPRVGRPVADILGPVEADASAGSGPRSVARDIREVLFYLGRPERKEPLADTLRTQARELDLQHAAAAGAVVDAILEW